MKPIKKILAPTDFSPASNNALAFAVSLASELNAKLYVLHSYRIPTVTDTAYPIGGVYPEGMVDKDDIKKEVANELNTIEQDFLKDGSLTYETLMKSGFVEDNIQEVVKENEIDLIVMGTRGANVLQELFGSTTTHIINNTNVPVLVIPKSAQFTKIENIVLASDYKKNYKTQTFDALLNMVQLFNATVDVLHVRPDNKKMSGEELEAGEGLNRILKKTRHAFHFQTEGEDVNDALENFLTQHENSMLAMLPHKHSLIDRMINGSKTQHMIFHTDKPLLLMRE